MANIIHLQDPFRPQINKKVFAIPKPTRIESILRKEKLVSGKKNSLIRNEPFLVILNDEFILEKDWNIKLKPTDILVTVKVPPVLQGGGGGSSPLRIVLQVALLVASYYVPVLAGLQAGSFAASAASAAIMIGGSLLINALLPINVKQPQMQDGIGKGLESYLIGSQNNSANLHGPIPVWYGYRKGYPDLAAPPYFECKNNAMYMHQLFCVTQGKIDIEQVYVEKTPIENFAEAEYEIIPPFGRVSLFNDNVYTSPEVQSLKLDGYIDGGDDIVGYESTSDGEMLNIKGKIQWIGGFVATPLGTTTSRLAVDISLPNGLCSFGDDGKINKNSIDYVVQARKLDDKNNPTSEWFTISDDITSPSWRKNYEKIIAESRKRAFGMGVNYKLPLSERITRATLDGQLITNFFDVPNGRYEVRMGLTSKKIENDTKSSSNFQWIGLRSYMNPIQEYGNVTMLAVKIKATNNINSSISRRINLNGTRILPVWDGYSWREKPTRSIAWATADIFMNQQYGRKLKQSRLNLEELLRLDSVWEKRNNFADGIFDSELTTWDAASEMLATGRAKPIYYAGVIDFYRAEPKSVNVGFFSHNNIVKDSFSVKYALPKSDWGDHVVVSYTDDTTWTPKEVICALPDSPMRKAFKLSLKFVSNRLHAWQEGIYMMASHQSQKIFTTLTTEAEGFIPRFGDKCIISHDVANWGSSGVIESFKSGVLKTNEPLPWVSGSKHVIQLRASNGSLMGSYDIDKVDDFSGRIKEHVEIGDYITPTHYIFGSASSNSSVGVMLSASPDSSGKVTMSFVNYSDYPHKVENILKPPVLDVKTVAFSGDLTIKWIKHKETLVENLFELSCSPASGATRYDFESSVDGGQNWVTLGSSKTPSITTSLPYGTIRVRARAVNQSSGAWFQQDVSVVETVHNGSDIPPKFSLNKIPSSNGNPVFAELTITGVDIPNVQLYVIEEGNETIYTGKLDVGQVAKIKRQFAPSGNKKVSFKAYGIDKFNKKSAAISLDMEY